MKKVYIILGVVVVAILTVSIFRVLPGSSGLIWYLTQGGTLLLPLIFFSAVLDSVHPCSFSILLITIAFLFSLNISRKKILAIGGVYIAGIFASYLLIGLGLLKVLHLFNTPHFMGKLGSAVLVIFGLLNVLLYLFPNFPIRLKIPNLAHSWMSRLMRKSSAIAAFGLGILVGLCQFPCMGGPYLMVIGLLRDQVTYAQGFGYLWFYNLILIIPLVAVLYVASRKELIDSVQAWRIRETQKAHLVVGVAMIIIGLLVLYI